MTPGVAIAAILLALAMFGIGACCWLLPDTDGWESHDYHDGEA